MSYRIGKLLLVIALFEISFYQSSLVQLVNYKETPVAQLLAEDNKLMHVFAGKKSFSYDSATLTFSKNGFNKSYLSSNPSRKIKRFNATIIVIVCGDNHLAFISEESASITSIYNSNKDFDQNGYCSFLAISPTLFFFAYSDSKQLQLELLSHDITHNTITSIQTTTIPSINNNYIACEYLKAYGLIMCVYRDNGLTYVKWYKDDMTNISSAPLNKIGTIELLNPLLLSVWKDYIVLFALIEQNIQVIKYKYDPRTQGIISTPNQISLNGFNSVIAWDIHLFSQSPTDEINNNELFLLTICLIDKCILYRYNFNLTLISKEVIISMLSLKHQIAAVSIALFNNDCISVLISTSSGDNYLQVLTYPDCNQLQVVQYQTDILSFANTFPSLHEMSISFSKGDMTILRLASQEELVYNKFYPFTDVMFAFIVSGNYEYQYVLRDSDLQESSTCTATFVICIPNCETCTGYGDSHNMKCSTCANGFYFSPAIPNQCINRDSCIALGGFIMENERKCVTSCFEFKMITNVIASECITHCSRNEILDPIKLTCLSKTDFSQNIENFIQDIDQHVINLYEHYPIKITKDYAMSIYNTSILPKNYSLEAITNGTPYEIVYLSSVFLGDCEIVLKKKYGLEQDKPLIIAKFDTKSNAQLTNVVNYTVYSNSGMKLNLDICKEENKPVIIASPIVDKSNRQFSVAYNYSLKGINAFNSTDDFFTDICYSYTSEYYTNIPLSDRVKDIMIDDAILCNLGCQYVSVDYQKNIVICSCSKETAHLYQKNYDTLLESFASFWVNSNFVVVKCYNLVFDLKKYSNNLGSWFMMLFVLIEAVNTLYFFFFGFNEIANVLMCLVSEAKDNNDLKILRNKKYNHSKINIDEKSNINGEVIYNSLQPKYKTPQIPLLNFNSIIQPNSINNDQYHPMNVHNMAILNSNLNKQSYNSNSISELSIKSKSSHIRINDDNNFKNMILRSKKSLSSIYNKLTVNVDLREMENKNNHINQIINNKPKSNTQIKRNSNAMVNYLYHKNNKKENQSRLNVKYTRESFLFFYWKFLQNSHPVINSFFIRNKHKTKVITVSMFFFSFSLSFTLNALFFSTKYVSKSYATKGKINFLFNLPKMIYSFLLSYFLKLLFTLLGSLSSVLSTITSHNEHKRKKELINELRIKLSIFYFLKLIILCFFWYYITAFCAVYPNIQMTWIISSLTSLLLEMLIPFVIAALLTTTLLISIKYNIMWVIKVLNSFVDN